MQNHHSTPNAIVVHIHDPPCITNAIWNNAKQIQSHVFNIRNRKMVFCKNEILHHKDLMQGCGENIYESKLISNLYANAYFEPCFALQMNNFLWNQLWKPLCLLEKTWCNFWNVCFPTSLQSYVSQNVATSASYNQWTHLLTLFCKVIVFSMPC